MDGDVRVYLLFYHQDKGKKRIKELPCDYKKSILISCKQAGFLISMFSFQASIAQYVEGCVDVWVVLFQGYQNSLYRTQ